MTEDTAKPTWRPLYGYEFAKIDDALDEAYDRGLNAVVAMKWLRRLVVLLDAKFDEIEWYAASSWRGERAEEARWLSSAIVKACRILGDGICALPYEVGPTHRASKGGVCLQAFWPVLRCSEQLCSAAVAVSWAIDGDEPAQDDTLDNLRVAFERFSGALAELEMKLATGR